MYKILINDYLSRAFYFASIVLYLYFGPCSDGNKLIDTFDAVFNVFWSSLFFFSFIYLFI
jgi:hypothetical protein